MNLEKAFRQYINQNKLFHTEQRLLVAVSGGGDSVVLTYLCKKSGFNFGIAHCNFQLRDAESEMDEQFVNSLAESYNLPFYSVRFDTAEVSSSEKKGIQQTARELRYEWFESIMKKYGFDLLITAHHAD